MNYRTGLLGRDLQGSLSPAFHDECFDVLGVQGKYQPVDFPASGLEDGDLAKILAGLVRDGHCGTNVTHPFKTAILPLLDDISPDAARLGAVNTVVIREGRTTGHNTDWLGFQAQLKGLEERAGPVSGPALVLGAGGAGRAVIYALLKNGVTPVIVHDPDVRQVQATLDHFGSADIQLAENLETAAGQAALIINASAVGMHGKGGLPLPEHLIHPDHMIAEVVYFPVETPLVRLARERGCRVATGDTMCLNQAIASFHLMTGLEPPDRQITTGIFARLLEAATRTG